jgi:hypothetical protein
MRHAHPEKSFNVSRWALEHDALTRFLMIVLMLLGVAAYFQLGQDEDPPFTFRAMVVRTYWPGATAQQVAEQVTDKLERTLQEAPFADKIRSYSKPGESQIIFQIKDSSKAADVPNVWYSVRKKIGDMKGTLPQGVIGPFFNDEFGDVYGVIYALESDGFSYAELKTFADDVRQQLLRVPDVAKVELFGVQDEKLYIEISQKRLAQLGLDMNAVLAQLGQQNAVESAGAVQTPLDVVQVRVAGQFNAVEDLRAMPIRGASGNQLRLSDIADIRRGYADPPSIKVRHQGKEVIALGVSMTKGGDIIELGKSLKTVTDHFDKALPLGMKLVQVQDQPKAVANSVNEFIKVLIEAVAIVLAVSFLSLGLHKRPGQHPLWRRWTLDIRPGLVVGITIPLVLAMTFLAMHYWGIGLHKISLGSLIIALGLLVDDAIIAVEMMVRKMEEGYDKVRAATFAYELTAMPMLTGTLITAAGFLPIGIAKLDDGGIHVCHLCRDGDCAGAELDRVGVLCALSRHAAAEDAAPCGGGQRGRAGPRRTARDVRQPLLQRVSSPGECVRAPPLDHHRRHRGAVRVGYCGHGQGAAAVLPGFEPPGDPGGPLASRGNGVRGQRRSGQAGRSAPDGAAGCCLGQPVGGFRRAPLLSAAGPDLSPVQRVATDRAGAGPEGTRIPAREAAGPVWHRSSRRCAGGSSCCPTARRCRIRSSSAWSATTRWCCASAPTRSRPSCARARTREA